MEFIIGNDTILLILMLINTDDIVAKCLNVVGYEVQEIILIYFNKSILQSLKRTAW
jgi:hypothetical protein